MSRNSYRIALISLTGLLALTPAFAQNQRTTSGSNTSGSQSGASGSGMASSRLSVGDDKFVRDAAESSLAEIALGQLGVQKAANADVKSFAQKMIDDHTQANSQLAPIASQKGVKLPTEPSVMHRAEADRISKLSGAEFDRAFMDQMVTDHQKVVAEFEHVSKGGKDADVKSFASTMLPKLQEHLRMARDLDRQVGGKKGGSGSMSHH